MSLAARTLCPGFRTNCTVMTICEAGLRLWPRELITSRSRNNSLVIKAADREKKISLKVDLAYVSPSDCNKLKVNCSVNGTFLLTHDDPLSHAGVAFFDWKDLRDVIDLIPFVSIGLCGKWSDAECNNR